MKQDLLTKPIVVAVLGQGGREHALALKIAESPLCSAVYVLPGNAGMMLTTPNALKPKLKTDSIEVRSENPKLLERLRALEVDLVVVGPDDLLEQGIVDYLESAGFAVFGPRRAAARIESSKAFAKEIMNDAGVPTAKHILLTDEATAKAEISKTFDSYPVVLKYDGLALGKGVSICADEHDVEVFLSDVFKDKKFERGQKGAATVVAEEFLTGHEVSLFALTDGEKFEVLEPACDHKRLLDGNGGPNTGGMGAYSPVPWMTREQTLAIADKIFPRVLEKMRDRKAPFRGLLYAGLMVRGANFWVLEFNARFGDPETQCLLPRLESDLLPLLYGVATGSLERHLTESPARWREESSVNIVVASRGYPAVPQKGFEIKRLETVLSKKVHFFSAAIALSADGKPVTNGGRVYSVSALGGHVDEARQRALAAIQDLTFEGMHFREDIGRVGSAY